MNHLDGDSSVAVIGLSCRFPGARNADEFWANVERGVESVQFFTDDELRRAGVDEALLSDPNYVKAKPVLDGIEWFDAAFFGFTRREAEIRDPQQRLFLECAYEALESSGYDASRWEGPIGVFASNGPNDYEWMNLRSNAELEESVGSISIATANHVDYVATTVAYRLNLRGPALTVQTACSSSLVAVHVACRSLLGGECDMALAGGTTIEIPHLAGYLYLEEGILSPDGHCRPFDAAAQGTIWGSGAGVVVLKRLSDALRDGDHVRAVILGSAVNNDGAGKVGFTAPGVDGQADVIAEAIDVAGVKASTLGYVEAHGTATPIGDPIEVAALTQAFRDTTDAVQHCALGSVKANIGHLGAAAGVAGLIKTVLALEHAAIPPCVHFQRPNPAIDFAASPFSVSSVLTPWGAGENPRRAGVSAFGIGGTNAHVVLQEAPPGRPPASCRPHQLMVLSARSPSALDSMTSDLRLHLGRHPEASLADVAHTLQQSRSGFAHRTFAVCGEARQAMEVLSAARRPSLQARQAVRGMRAAFLFSGQGSQYAGMARDLYDVEPVFRAEVDRCAELLVPHIGLDLRQLLYPGPGEGVETDALDQTAFTQPALFTVEYALAQLCGAWGIRPKSMIGHSIGEYVAACMAGVFDLPDVLEIIAHRGRLMQSLPPGGMLAVSVSEDALTGLLGPSTAVAAVNGPRQCVVSGPTAEVERVRQQLVEGGRSATWLRTSHAFHSPMMDPVATEFERVVSRFPLRAPQIPFVSNVTGRWITSEEATSPGYWRRQLRECVRFWDGLDRLLDDPGVIPVEVGPGRALAGMARLRAGRDGVPAPNLLPARGDGAGGMESALRALGTMWASGVDVDWNRFSAGQDRRRVALPTYPWQRERYWIDPPTGAAPSARRTRYARRPLEQWFSAAGWRQLPPLTGIPASRRHWLLFADGEFAEGLRARLLPEAESVTTVAAGTSPARIDPDRFVLELARPGGYDEVLTAVHAAGRWPAGIVHAYGAQPDLPASVQVEPDAAREELDRGFFSVLHLVQALSRMALDGCELVTVSSHAEDVTGRDLTRPLASTLGAAAKVVPLEISSLRVRHVDTEFPPERSDLARPLDALAAELLAGRDDAVALRASKRWAPAFEPFQLGGGTGGHGLRDGGVYLITGGLGAIGLAIAERLASTCRPHLVLLGRSGLSGPSEARVRRLEELGARVLVVRGDVCDPDRMSEVKSLIQHQAGRLDGIIHAAGLAGAGMAEVKDPAIARQVLDPKVIGTLVLDRVFGDLDLDFMLLCSSVTAVTGGFGQLDYCAANRFLDAYARSRQGCRPVMSINWGPWLGAGMAVRTAAPDAFSALQAGAGARRFAHPLVHELRRGRGGGTAVAEAVLDPGSDWVLGEHRIDGVPVLPGTAYLEMARAAFDPAGDRTVVLRDVAFLAPLAVRDGEAARVEVALEDGPDGSAFCVRKLEGPGPTPATEHARGAVAAAPPGPEPVHDLDAVRARCSGSRATGRPVGEGLVAFGPRWSSLRRVFVGDGEQLAYLEAPDTVANELPRYVLHPALLDEATSFVQIAGDDGARFLPLGYGEVTVRRRLTPRIFSHATLHSASDPSRLVACDIVIMDEAGREMVAIKDFLLRRIDPAEVTRSIAEGGRPARMEAGRARSDPAVAEPVEVGIMPDEGAEAFARLVAARPAAQVIVSPAPLDAVLDRVRAVTERAIERTELPLADRRPAAGGAGAREGFVAPRTPVERAVAELCEEVLGSSRLGVDDDFFDLGGNSLVAVQLISRIWTALRVRLPMRRMFEASTVGGIAMLIEELRGGQRAEPGADTSPRTASPTSSPTAPAGPAAG
jgi:phthiocerol/phenolphthiocerol synthesis type-I polyketide synthase E